MKVSIARRSVRIAPRSIVIAVLASIPFAASLGFHAIERSQRPPLGTVDRPALAFDQYLVNLGEVRNTPRAEAVYRFMNRSQSTVRITRVEPSCNCLKPKLTKREYLPGETGEIVLGMLTTHEDPGPHEYQLTIDYEDPTPRTVTVAFKLSLRLEVTLSPSRLLFYQNGRDSAEQTVTVNDFRPKPLRVTGAASNSSNVRVRVENHVDEPDGGRRTAVVITVAPEASAKGEWAEVVLSTDDPRFPRIPIPLLIRDVRAVGKADSPQSKPAGPPAGESKPR